MKFASAVPALSTLVALALGAGTALAEAGIAGSVLRLDERTYRIHFEATYELTIWPGCEDGNPATCEFCPCPYYCYDWSYFTLSGPFSLPTNLDPDRNCVEVLQNEEGFIWCHGPCTNMSIQFDFEPSSAGTSRLALTWVMQGEYLCSACVFNDTICGNGFNRGEVYAVLPSRIGDAIPLEPVVAVEPSTWSTVKQLYRE